MLPGASDGLTGETVIRLIQAQPAGKPVPILPELRQAAVLVPLVWDASRWHLLFTRRTETVNSHKGQVSFPGGAADPQDASPEATALREADEEIGLQPQDVRIFGRLASRRTVSNYVITPVVGQIRWPYAFRVSPLEVDRLFTIPLNWLADPANREERPRAFPGGVNEKVIYFQAYDGEILWGATARITLDLLKTLKLAP